MGGHLETTLLPMLCATCLTVPDSPVLRSLLLNSLWDRKSFRFFHQGIFFATRDCYHQRTYNLIPWQQVGNAFHKPQSRRELDTIASKPAGDHVFQVDNFEALNTIRNQLQEKIFAIEGEPASADQRFLLSIWTPASAPLQPFGSDLLHPFE